MHDSNIVYVSNENKYIPSIFSRRYAITMMNLTHCKVKIIISPKEKYLLHFKKILESKDHCIERDALRIYNCLVYDIREVDCRFDANKKTTDVKKRNQFISLYFVDPNVPVFKKYIKLIPIEECIPIDCRKENINISQKYEKYVNCKKRWN